MVGPGALRGLKGTMYELQMGAIAESSDVYNPAPKGILLHSTPGMYTGCTPMYEPA